MSLRGALAAPGSDGCTRAPDLNFRACCEEHDEDYRTRRVPRAVADAKLRRCIARKFAAPGWRYRLVPWIYWLGVRAFGWLHYGAPSDVVTSPAGDVTTSDDRADG